MLDFCNIQLFSTVFALLSSSGEKHYLVLLGGVAVC